MDALPIDTQLWDQQVRVVIQTFAPALDSTADQIDTRSAVNGLPQAGLALEYVLDSNRPKQVHFFGIELSQQIDCKYGLVDDMKTSSPDVNTTTDTADVVQPGKVWRDYDCALAPELAAYYGRQFNWQQSSRWTVSTQVAAGLAVEAFNSNDELDVHLNIVPINAQYQTSGGFTIAAGLDIAPLAYQNEGLVRLSMGRRF
ncbi:hypothetical protein [Salinibius halmophilus]|uniref:hypothetical protein n=1 Tax=Salinibius halmophilus TaxID=1853216 RepID=UPI000E672249|nr:hypothetical protein [Salinibius halmophilus]